MPDIRSVVHRILSRPGRKEYGTTSIIMRPMLLDLLRQAWEQEKGEASTLFGASSSDELARWSLEDLVSSLYILTVRRRSGHRRSSDPPREHAGHHLPPANSERAPGAEGFRTPLTSDGDITEPRSEPSFVLIEQALSRPCSFEMQRHLERLKPHAWMLDPELLASAITMGRERDDTSMLAALVIDVRQRMRRS